MQACYLLGPFFPFFPFLTSIFWFYFAQHLLLFLKHSTVLFATLSSESSARFLIFECNFSNLLKSFFVGFETFLTSGEPRFSGQPQQTNSLLFLRVNVETANLVLHAFRYLSISCSLGDFLPG